jgi:hypothetical protein
MDYCSKVVMGGSGSGYETEPGPISIGGEEV